MSSETVTIPSALTRHLRFGCRLVATNPAYERWRPNCRKFNTLPRILSAWCEPRARSNLRDISFTSAKPLVARKWPSVRLTKTAALTCSLAGRRLGILTCKRFQKTTKGTVFALPARPRMPQRKEALFSKKSYGYFMPKLRHSSRAKRNKPNPLTYFTTTTNNVAHL